MHWKINTHILIKKKHISCKKTNLKINVTKVIFIYWFWNCYSFIANFVIINFFFATCTQILVSKCIRYNELIFNFKFLSWIRPILFRWIQNTYVCITLHFFQKYLKKTKIIWYCTVFSNTITYIIIDTILIS